VARQAFEILLDSKASFNVKTNAGIELMDLESAEGNRVAFERCRQQARRVESKMPPTMAVDFHYKEGIGLARFTQMVHARRSLEEALALAERHHLNEWYFRLERVLASLDRCADTVPAAPQSGRIDVLEAPALAEVAAGLQRYAETATP
jgi:hypothetical protein